MALLPAMPPPIVLLPPIRSYGIQPKKRRAAFEWLLDGFARADATVIEKPDRLDQAPFVVVLEVPGTYERVGIVGYIFTSTCRSTRNRPGDEVRFQIKYGSKRDNDFHELFLDPHCIWVTLLVGIDVENGTMVSCDPIMHNPTRMFVSVEYKLRHVEVMRSRGWAAWERERRDRVRDRFVLEEESILTEVLVGCTQRHALDLVLFERAARGLPPEYRLKLAEGWLDLLRRPDRAGPQPSELLRSLGLSQDDLNEMIEDAPRLLMAVRGWAAQRHLLRMLERSGHVERAEAIERDGAPDLRVTVREPGGGSRTVLIECKNARSQTLADGTIRVDLMRTRAPKGYPCGRYYEPGEFDVLAVCLHPVSGKWEFRFRRARDLPKHPECQGRLNHNVRLDATWATSLEALLPID